jgi:hypothetical protein
MTASWASTEYADALAGTNNKKRATAQIGAKAETKIEVETSKPPVLPLILAFDPVIFEGKGFSPDGRSAIK